MAVKYMLSQPSDGNTLLVTVTNIRPRFRMCSGALMP